jgi:hypothetical protein
MNWLRSGAPPHSARPCPLATAVSLIGLQPLYCFHPHSLFTDLASADILPYDEWPRGCRCVLAADVAGIRFRAKHDPKASDHRILPRRSVRAH